MVSVLFLVVVFSDGPERVQNSRTVYQIYDFSDASNSAMACVVCLRLVDKSGQSSVAFV